MIDKLPDVWATRDFPVLVEVARRLDGGARTVLLHDVAAALEMAEQAVEAAGVALSRRGLVQTQGLDAWRVYDFTELGPEAYVLTGLHPSGDDAVSSLVAALRQAAEVVDDPEEKTRLRALADGALGVGRGVLGAVLTTWITAHVPS